MQALLDTLDLPGIDKAKLSELLECKIQDLHAQGRIDVKVSAQVKLDVLLKTLREAGKKNTLDELAQAMLPQLTEILQTSHCLLFMLTRSGEQRVRTGYGNGIDEIRKTLKIEAKFSPTAFHAAIKNNIDVSIPKVSWLKDASLPAGYRDLFPRVTRFIILPIANDSVSGLLYCDWETEGRLNASEVESIKSLRDLFRPMFPK